MSTQAGDLLQVEDSGSIFYIFKEIEAGKRQDNIHSHHVKSGNLALGDKDNFQALNNAMDFKWDSMLGKATKALENTDGGGGGTGAQAAGELKLILKLPEGAEELFMQAINSAEKLLKQAMAVHSAKLDNGDKGGHFENLKKALATMMEQKQELDYICNFKEKKNGQAPNRSECESLLGTFAETVSMVSIQVEVCKAINRTDKPRVERPDLRTPGQC